MADWQEKMQSMIIGFVFTYMVVKLSSVISSFRAGNLRVTRESDDEVPLRVPSEAAELSPADEQSTPLVATDEETEADGDNEPEDSAHDSSSSSSSDSEVENDATAACSPREIDSAINPTVSKVKSNDDKVDATKDELVEFKKDERVEDENIEAKHVGIPGEHSLKPLNEQASGDAEDELEESRSATDDWEGIESTELEKRFGAASTYASTMVVSPNVKSSSDALLQLYAFYKIATEGPCSNPQPSILQPTARAKWNEWRKLGSMPQEEAMQKYIAVMTEINPTWYETYQKSKEPARVTDQNDRDSSQSGGEMDSLPGLSKLVTSGGGQADIVESIHACVIEGDLEHLGELIDLGSSIDKKDGDGRTPLILAANRGQLNVVKILIAKGAEIHEKVTMAVRVIIFVLKSSSGAGFLSYILPHHTCSSQALHHATLHGQEPAAKYLVQHGADVNAVDNDGTSPLKLCPPHWLWLQDSAI